MTESKSTAVKREAPRLALEASEYSNEPFLTKVIQLIPPSHIFSGRVTKRNRTIPVLKSNQQGAF